MWGKIITSRNGSSGTVRTTAFDFFGDSLLIDVSRKILLSSLLFIITADVVLDSKYLARLTRKNHELFPPVDAGQKLM